MRRKVTIVIGTFVGIVVLLLVGLQLALNSSYARRLIDGIVADNILGKLKYGDLSFSLYRHFPKISVELDSLSLTAEDAPQDTLLALDHLGASLQLFPLLQGHVNVPELDLRSLKVSVSGLLSAIKPSESSAEENSSGFSISRVSLGSLSLEGNNKITYSDSLSLLSLEATLSKMRASGVLDFTSEGLVTTQESLYLETLDLDAFLPKSGDMCYRIDTLDVSRGEGSEYALRLASLAEVRVKALKEKFEVPVNLLGYISIAKHLDTLALGARGLKADIAFVPFRLEGGARLLPDGAEVDATLGIEECSVDDILHNYADKIFSRRSNITTDARLSAEASAKGTLSQLSVPVLDVCLRIPKSQTVYTPTGFGVGLTLDVDAHLSEEGDLSADIDEFKLKIPGLAVSVDGSADDILGLDPSFDVKADADAHLPKLLALVPGLQDQIAATGDVKLNLKAKTLKSELLSLRFPNSTLGGKLTSDSLRVSLLADSLDVDIYSLDLRAGSGPKNLGLTADCDSLFLNMGTALSAKIRGFHNRGGLAKTMIDTLFLPKLGLNTGADRLFVRYGDSRLALNGSAVEFGAQKIGSSPRRRRDWAAGEEIEISLDTLINRIFRNWSLTAGLSARGGMVSTPSLPLRTRLQGVGLSFKDQTITLDSLKLTSGTSDISASGYMTGLREAIYRKKMLKAELALRSERINANELIAAFMLGDSLSSGVTSQVSDKLAEEETVFTTDTLADATPLSEGFAIPLIMMPANVDASVSVSAGRIDLSEPRIGPVTSGIRLKNSTLQLSSTNIDTSLGNIYLDAFYSTPSKDDISTGINVRLSDMTAQDVINLVPSVDTLMPVLKSFYGKINFVLSATTKIDSTMNVIMPSLDGVVRVDGSDLKVKNNVQFGKLVDKLLFKKQEWLNVDNLHADALIHNSKIEVFPFQLSAGKYKIALRGTQNFDSSMYYHISLLKSPFPAKFGVNIFGTIDNWHYSIGKAQYKDGNIPAFTRQIDTVQYNLARSISQIYNRRVVDVVSRNEISVRELGQTLDSQTSDTIEGDSSEDDAALLDYSALVDDAILSQEMEEQESDLQDEVDQILSDSMLDAERLLGDYEKTIVNKRVERKMARLRRKEEKAAAKAAKAEN